MVTLLMLKVVIPQPWVQILKYLGIRLFIAINTNLKLHNKSLSKVRNRFQIFFILCDLGCNSFSTFYLATPNHEYTAWIIVNHVHLVDANALLSTICAAYTGPKPPSCEQHQLSEHMQMVKKPENKKFNDAISKGDWGCANDWSSERQ